MKRLIPALLTIALLGDTHPLRAQEMDTVLDAFSQQLRFSDSEGLVRASISGTLDLEGHLFDGEPPALLRTNDEWLIQPRATVFLDVQAGNRLYGFAQARLDRGFDARYGSLKLRLDEYALRFTPWKDGRLSIQAGQFATVAGRWVSRHLSWQNPFIRLPCSTKAPPASVICVPPHRPIT